MKKLLLFLSFIIIHLVAMEDNTFSVQFTDITTVVAQTCDVLKKLDEQTWKNYKIGAIMRYLPVDDYNSCLIIDYLCNATRKRLDEEKKWHVNSFSHLSKIRDDYGRIINQGIYETAISRYLYMRYPLFHFQTQLDDVIHNIQKNWRYFNPKKYPDMLYANLIEDRSNRYGYVIVKPYQYPKEDNLIYFLGLSFGLTNEEFACSTDQIEMYGKRNLVILWFNIWSRDKIINFLGLKIEE